MNKAAKLGPSKNGQACVMSQGYINCVSFNSNGTRKRASQLENLLTTYADIGFLQETKGTTPNIAGFSCEMSDQRLNDKGEADKHGGGICTYVSNRFKVVESWTLKDNLAQANAIIINGTMIVNVYRPPQMNRPFHRDQDIKFWNELDKLSHKNLILVGDFNLPRVNVNSGVNGESHAGARCLEFCEKHHLMNMVESVTRRGTRKKLKEAKSRGTTLDWILTNRYDYVLNVEVLDESHDIETGSDHFPVTFQLLNPSMKLEPDIIRVRDLKRANWKEYNQRLYHMKIRGETNEEKVSSLAENIVTCFDQVAPYINIDTRKRLPHDTNETMDIQRRINKMSGKDLSEDQLERRKILQSKLYNMRQKLRIKKELRILEQKSITATARYRRKMNINIKKLKKVTGEVVTEGKDIVKTLHEHFESKNIKPDNATYETNYDVTSDSLSEITIRESDVQQMIEKLKINTAPGPDNCTPTMIRKAKKVIAKLITPIMNDIFNECKYPQCWKSTNITPIHKKGSKQEVSNYRNIQCSNILGKLFESILQKHLYEHVEENNYLPETQHAYRKFKGVLTNLTEFWSRVGVQIDNGKQMDVIFIDFSQAFDLINHQLMIHKLSEMNVRGKFLKTLKDYLKDRTGRIKQHPEYSEEIKMENGTPQGGTISALLFALSTADLVETLKKNTKNTLVIESLYADDVKIAIEVEDGVEETQKVVQTILDNLKEWCSKNFMKVNATKSKVMHVRQRNYSLKKSDITNKFHEYNYNGQKLEAVEEFTDLGLVVTNDLVWKKHIAKNVMKAKMKFAEIRSKFYVSNMNLLKKAWQCYIEPILYYCCPLFAGSPINHLFPIMRFQQYFFRGTRIQKDEWMPFDAVTRMNMLTTSYSHSIVHKHALLKTDTIYPHVHNPRNRGLELTTPKFNVTQKTPIADYNFSTYSKCLWKRVNQNQRCIYNKEWFKWSTRENWTDGRFFVHWTKSRKRNYYAKAYNADYLKQFHSNERQHMMYGRGNQR